MSKGYTLNYFINTFTSTTAAAVSREGVYRTVSPRLGFNSVASYQLDKWLEGQTQEIANGTGDFSSYGKTSRARILRALRNRKNTGTI